MPSSSSASLGPSSGNPPATPPRDRPSGLTRSVPGTCPTIPTCSRPTSSTPDREVRDGNVPRAHRKYVNGDHWRKNDIEVRGLLKQATLTAPEEFLDTMKTDL